MKMLQKVWEVAKAANSSAVIVSLHICGCMISKEVLFLAYLSSPSKWLQSVPKESSIIVKRQRVVEWS